MTPSLGLFNYTRAFSLGWHYLPKQFSPFDSRINKYEDWLIESSGSAFQLPHHITSTWPATIFHIVGGPFRFFGGCHRTRRRGRKMPIWSDQRFLSLLSTICFDLPKVHLRSLSRSLTHSLSWATVPSQARQLLSSSASWRTRFDWSVLKLIHPNDRWAGSEIGRVFFLVDLL